MFKLNRVIFLLLITAFFLFEYCSTKKEKQRVVNSTFEIINFDATSNFQTKETKIKTISLDYKNAMKGFVIPSANQVAEGFFKFKFELKNVSNIKQKFYYKIYYENYRKFTDNYKVISNKEANLYKKIWFICLNNPRSIVGDLILPEENKCKFELNNFKEIKKIYITDFKIVLFEKND